MNPATFSWPQTTSHIVAHKDPNICGRLGAFYLEKCATKPKIKRFKAFWNIRSLQDVLPSNWLVRGSSWLYFGLLWTKFRCFMPLLENMDNKHLFRSRRDPITWSNKSKSSSKYQDGSAPSLPGQIFFLRLDLEWPEVVFTKMHCQVAPRMLLPLSLQENKVSPLSMDGLLLTMSISFFCGYQTQICFWQ